jgi:hypothetical protein
VTVIEQEMASFSSKQGRPYLDGIVASLSPALVVDNSLVVIIFRHLFLQGTAIPGIKSGDKTFRDLQRLIVP